MSEQGRQPVPIHFTGDRFAFPENATFPWLNRGHVCSLGILALVLIYWSLEHATGALPHLNPIIVLIGITAVFMIVGIIWWLCSSSRIKRQVSDTPPQSIDYAARLQVSGKPDDFVNLGSFADVPFEPRSFLASLSVKRSLKTTWVQLLLAAVLAVLGWYTDHRMGPYLGEGGAYIIVSSAYLLSLAFVAVLYPIDMRVTPGRLEVLNYAWHRLSPVSTRTFDLRSARVWIDLPQRRVFIQDGEKSLGISLELLPRHREFAYMLLLGAVSTHKSPDPPP